MLVQFIHNTIKLFICMTSPDPDVFGTYDDCALADRYAAFMTCLAVFNVAQPYNWLTEANNEYALTVWFTKVRKGKVSNPNVMAVATWISTVINKPITDLKVLLIALGLVIDLHSNEALDNALFVALSHDGGIEPVHKWREYIYDKRLESLLNSLSPSNDVKRALMGELAPTE